MEREELITWAREAGFAAVGFCSPEDFTDAYKRVERQPKLRERNQLRFFPREDAPWIQSLAVLLWAYQPTENTDRDAVFVDAYYQASNAAYHAAKALEERLLLAGRRAQANVAYPAKEAALRAGLGVIGENSLLITKEWGTRVVIILIATDFSCDEAAASRERIACLRCGRCMKACPSGALDENGMSHPERCLRNFMMEGLVVPEALRERMGMRLIGCDICQQVCPMQPGKKKESAAPFLLDDFVTVDEERFRSSVYRLAQQVGKNTARPQRVRAQAALLCGNRGKKTYLPVLRLWLQSSFEAVREHALWAIERIEGRNAMKH